ncbi:MAG: peptidylprolyl isomerase [Fusobacteriaceae bacterium]
MAIRKFRKNLKPFIWTMTLAFVFSMVLASYGEIKNLFSETKSHAFKINGEKAEKIDIERNKMGIIDSYSKTVGFNINSDVAGTIAVDEVINKKLSKEMAKKLKINVPQKEIDEQFNTIQNNFQDKEQFMRMLSAQGFTRDTLKKELEEILTVKKVKEKFNSDIKITEDEIEKYFIDNKYSKFSEDSLDEVKDRIASILRGEKAKREYMITLEKAKKAMKLEDVAEEYNTYVPNVAFELQGFQVKNIDMAQGTVAALYSSQGDGEVAKKTAYDRYEALIKIAKEAILKGITVEENLPLDMKLEEYRDKLSKKMEEEIVLDERDVIKYFEENKAKYDKGATAEAEVTFIPFVPSDKDKENTKNRAENLIKDLNVENFAEMAKKYSKDPGSAVNGGALGWFTKGMMVKPFENAVFEGEVGKIYPEPIETEYGYHIIFIHERDEAKGGNASHILLTPEISNETRKSKEETAKRISEELKSGKIIFNDLEKENLIEFSKKIENINENGFIPGMGYNKELTNKIFKSKVNEINLLQENEGIYIVKKLMEKPAVKADLNQENIRNKVSSELKTKKIAEEMQKIMSNL